MVITPEQRKQGGIRSGQVRRERATELANLRALLASKPIQAVPEPELEQPQYLIDRLSRVRKQLDKIDELMISELDPQKLDRLASASSRLEEQERRLSGRFIPGSTKPTTDRPRRTTSGGPTPIDSVPGTSQ